MRRPKKMKTKINEAISEITNLRNRLENQKKELEEETMPMPMPKFAPSYIEGVFKYLKENLSIDVDCDENSGYYDTGSTSVTVRLFLKNPNSGENVLISESSGNVYK